MANQNITVRVELTGARSVRNGLSSIGNDAKKSMGGLSGLNGALGGIGRILGVAGIAAGVAAAGLVALGSSAASINNKLAVVSTSQENLNRLFSEVTTLALDTRSPLADVADSFSRISRATDDLGLGQREALDLTKSVTQALVVSGATAQETSATLVQFGQALSSGRLGGDELRSITEQGSALAEALADGLNETKAFGAGVRVTTGDLRQLGKEGKLSSEVVVKALQSQAEELQAAFDKTTPTIQQAFENIRTQATGLVRNSGLDQLGATILQGFSELLPALQPILNRAVQIVFGLIEAFKRFFQATAPLFGFLAETAGKTFSIIGEIVGNFVIGAVAVIGLWFADFVRGFSLIVGVFQNFPAVVNEFFIGAINKAIKAVENFVNGAIDALNSVAGAVGLPQIGRIDLKEFEDRASGTFRNIAVVANGLGNDIEQGTVNAVRGLVEGFAAGEQKAKDLQATLALSGSLNAGAPGAGRGSGGEGRGRPKQSEAEKEAERLLERQLDLARDLRDEFNPLEAAQAKFTQQTEALNVALARGVITQEQYANATAGIKRQLDDTLDPYGKLINEIRRETQEIGLSESRRAALNAARELGAQLAITEEEAVRRFADGLQVEIEKRDEAAKAAERLMQAREAAIEAQERQFELAKEVLGIDTEAAERAADLQDLRNAGVISEIDLQRELLALRIENNTGTFLDGYISKLQEFSAEADNVGQKVGEIFGDASVKLAEGFGTAITDALLGTKDLSTALSELGRTILREVIGSLIKLAIQYVINRTIAAAFEKTALASGAATAAGLLAAYQPAAIAASIATFGAAAASGTAAYIASQATGAAFTAASSVATKIGGFADGGFVPGSGGPRADDVLARLSSGEFVVNARQAEANAPLLQAINNGNGQVAVGGGGSSNVSITNVLDPGIALDAIDTEQGTEVILNIMERNSNRIKQVLR